MAKIKTYDYNREENTLTVTYESGTIRKYSVDRLPKTLHTFICEDVVYCTISSLIEEYKAEQSLFVSVRRDSSISSDIRRDSIIKSSALFHKYNTLRELFLNRSISKLCYEIRYWYSVFSDAVSSDDEFYVQDRKRNVPSLEAIKELAKRLGFSPDDDSFELTFSHILSIKFPETAPSETVPVEEPEPVYTLPYPLEVPFDMRINRLCSKCRYLYSCFRENRARVLEDIHDFEPCDDICGECTLCCNNFKPTIQTVPKVSAFSADDDTGDDLPF